MNTCDNIELMKDIKTAKSLIACGSGIAGSAAAAAIEFLAGSPQMAAIGAVFGSAITWSLTEIGSTILAQREQARIGATAAFAIEKITNMKKLGLEPRKDGFFDKDHTGRSNAEEIFEGVLLKAKNMHEERKAKILGNIFANVAFHTELSLGEANHLVQIAEDLTYRQMCILALIKKKDELSGIRLKQDSYDEAFVFEADDGIHIDFSSKTRSVLQQTYELFNRGLIICTSAKPDITALMTASDIIPSELLLTIMGIKYYEIMELDDIDEKDVREVAQYLQ